MEPRIGPATDWVRGRLDHTRPRNRTLVADDLIGPFRTAEIGFHATRKVTRSLGLTVHLGNSRTQGSPMTPRMTSTALKRGFTNALRCSLIVVGSWLLVGGAIAIATGRERVVSLSISFALLCGLTLLTFFLTWLLGRNAGGRVVVDCGPHPGRWLFLFEAGLFALMGAGGSLAMGESSMAPRVASAVFGLVFAMYWLVLATSRLQVKEGGLWQYTGLLPWHKVESFSWSPDSTLQVTVKGRFALLRHGALPVPPEYRQDVEKALKERCPSATEL